MEAYDVLDVKGNKLGYKKIRGKEREVNEHILAVHLWIKNKEGKYLMQQRSFNIKAPGRWTPLTGGVIAGETSMEALKRELEEEYGLNLDNYKPKFINKTLPTDNNWFWLYDLYLIEADIDLSLVKFDKEVIETVNYFALEEIEELYKEEKAIEYRENYIGYIFPK